MIFLKIAKENPNIVQLPGFTFNIKDSSISRLIQHSKTGLAILSATRAITLSKNKAFDDYTEEEKNDYYEAFKKSKELEQDLRSLGLGYIPTLGGYGLDVSTENDKEVIKHLDELSYAIPYKPNIMTEPQFFDAILKLGKKYNQESVLIALPSYNNGNPTYVEPINPPDLWNNSMSFDKNETTAYDPNQDIYYTELRKKGRPVPEEVKTGKGIIFGGEIPSEDQTTFKNTKDSLPQFKTLNDLNKYYFGRRINNGVLDSRQRYYHSSEIIFVDDFCAENNKIYDLLKGRK